MAIVSSVSLAGQCTRIAKSGSVLAVAVTAALLAGTAGATHERTGSAQLARVVVSTQAEYEQLATLGIDLSEHAGPGYVDAVLHSRSEAERLRAHRFRWTVTIPDLAARERMNSALNADYATATDVSPLPSGRDTYRTLADYNADLQRLALENPTLVRLVTLSRRSLEGREILGVEISDNVASKTDGKPVFLIMGLHHAREWPSGEHTIEFAFDLVQGFGSNPRVTALLQRARVVVVPVVNVDGFEQSRKWGALVGEIGSGDPELPGQGNVNKRKNCRVVDGEATAPGGCEPPSPGGWGVGIDLNRNYGWLWGGRGASDVLAHPQYHGPAAFSEPETQAIRELVSSRHVTMLITNHSFSNLVLRPPGLRREGSTVDEPAMRAIGARMVAQNGYRNIRGWELYDTTGTTDAWSYNATGGFAFTFEIGAREFRPPFSQVVDGYVGVGPYAGKGNREAFFIGLEGAVDPRRHAIIRGKAPGGAVLRLSKTFRTRTTGASIPDRLSSNLVVPAGGRFVWHVNPSTRPEVKALAKIERYRLTCTRPGGKVLETLTVAVDRGATARLDLRTCTTRFKR